MRIRTIGTGAQRRAALSFIDQSVSSISNFASGVVVARLSGAAEFGQYMLVLVIWLLAVGIHRALVTEPVIVISRETDDWRRLVSHGLSAELLLASAVSLLVAAGGITASVAGARAGTLMLASSPWFISLLIQDYWRGMAFQQRRPGLALVNDLLFAAVQGVVIVVFWAIGWRSAAHVIAAWGIGATAGALLGVWWFRVLSPRRDGGRLLRRLWPLSRWMLMDFLTGFAANQGYLFFAVLLLSDVDYGGFRAAFNLMGPIVVIVHAGANIGLPEASRRTDLKDLAPLRQFARRLSAATFILVAIYGAFVAFSGKQLLIFLYGSDFGRFAPLATLAAIQHILAVSVFGHAIALKAAGRMRGLWRARLLAASASLASMVLLVSWVGALGAGWAGVATALYYVGAVYAIYTRELIRVDSKPSELSTLVGSLFRTSNGRDGPV